MKVLKILGVVIFGCGAIGGLTSLPGITDQTSRNQTAVFTILLIALTALCIWSIIKGNQKKKKQLEDAKEAERIAEEQRAQLQARIKEIESLSQLPVVEFPMSIMLKPEEVCYYQSNATTLVVKNQVVGRTGGHGGVSIRVAKGLTLHTGKTAGQQVREDVPYYYPGIFSITNKRVIMTGEKGFDFSIEKLSSLTEYADGVEIQFGRSSFTILLDEPYFVQKIFSLIQRENGVISNQDSSSDKIGQ